MLVPLGRMTLILVFKLNQVMKEAAKLGRPLKILLPKQVQYSTADSLAAPSTDLLRKLRSPRDRFLYE